MSLVDAVDFFKDTERVHEANGAEQTGRCTGDDQPGAGTIENMLTRTGSELGTSILGLGWGIGSVGHGG
jgi:hypothetical protein